MKSFLMKCLAITILPTACLAQKTVDLGRVEIGCLPATLSIFKESTCDDEPYFADCSAVDQNGITYVFFDNALVRVSAQAGDAQKDLRLPMNLVFGELIDSARTKVERELKVPLNKGKTSKGRIVYTSDALLNSASGWTYTIELIADSSGRFTKIVQRTNLP